MLFFFLCLCVFCFCFGLVWFVCDDAVAFLLHQQCHLTVLNSLALVVHWFNVLRFGCWCDFTILLVVRVLLPCLKCRYGYTEFICRRCQLNSTVGPCLWIYWGRKILSTSCSVFVLFYISLFSRSRLFICSLRRVIILGVSLDIVGFCGLVGMAYIALLVAREGIVSIFCAFTWEVSIWEEIPNIHSMSVISQLSLMV